MFYSSASDAISASVSSSRSLLVAVYDSSAPSEQLRLSIHDDEMIALLFEHDIIMLDMESSSEDFRNFSMIYPVLLLPCLYFISPDGKLLDVMVGPRDHSSILEWLEKQLHQDPTESSTVRSIGRNDTSRSSISRSPTRQKELEEIRVRSTEIRIRRAQRLEQIANGDTKKGTLEKSLPSQDFVDICEEESSVLSTFSPSQSVENDSHGSVDNKQETSNDESGQNIRIQLRIISDFGSRTSRRSFSRDDVLDEIFSWILQEIGSLAGFTVRRSNSADRLRPEDRFKTLSECDFADVETLDVVISSTQKVVGDDSQSVDQNAGGSRTFSHQGWWQRIHRGISFLFSFLNPLNWFQTASSSSTRDESSHVEFDEEEEEEDSRSSITEEKSSFESSSRAYTNQVPFEGSRSHSSRNRRIQTLDDIRRDRDPTKDSRLHKAGNLGNDKDNDDEKDRWNGNSTVYRD